jgi:hypothetical protein
MFQFATNVKKVKNVAREWEEWKFKMAQKGKPNIESKIYVLLYLNLNHCGG